MNSKKSQSLSMNTIIIAALALLVLAIVSLLFIGRMNISREGLNTCENNGGRCIDVSITGSQTECWTPAIRNRPEFGQYSSGRRIRNQCYDAQGNVNTNQICCVFS